MSNTTHNEEQVPANKLNCINNSINLMTDCVKHLEKIRSYNFFSNTSEPDLEKVIDYLHKIEESIEILQKSTKNKADRNLLLRAIGKNRKLLVTKPPQKTPDLNIGNKQSELKDSESKIYKNITASNPKTTPKAFFENKNNYSIF
jgi:hypothetical protein